MARGEQEGEQAAKVPTHADKGQSSQVPETRDGEPAVATVRSMLSRGQPQPQTIAKAIQRAPGRNDALAFLHQTLGNAFVQQVLGALESSKKTAAGVETSRSSRENLHDSPSATLSLPAPLRVRPSDGLNVRSSPVHGDNVVGLLPMDHRVEGLKQTGDWISIQHQGTEAFIHTGFVEPASKNAAAPASTPVAIPAAPTPVTADPTAKSGDPNKTAPEHASTTVEPEHEKAATTAHAGKNEFETANHNIIAKTTQDEADVLRDLRKAPRRFDPSWLVTAQANLGVIDATGAMNTETLRKIREKSGHPKLDAHGILNDPKLLAELAPGEPFFAGAETGTHDHKSPTPGAEGNKDKTVQELGYADFTDYRIQWGSSNVQFMGHDFGAPAHPYLKSRLKVAEAYLHQRVKGPNGEKLNDTQIAKQLGWNTSGQETFGNASYHHQATNPQTHQHAMGLAIDIQPAQNAYMFESSSGWVTYFEELSVYAQKMFGGEILHPKTLLEWSQQLSTEELFQRVQSASSSFSQLLQYAKSINGNEEDPGLLEKVRELGYQGADAKKAAHQIAAAEKSFHLQQGRRNATGPMNLNEEMVIALRDVAGLAWGGAEIAAGENGDMMHFDCRHTDFGNQVYEAGRKHKPAQ